LGLSVRVAGTRAAQDQSLRTMTRALAVHQSRGLLSLVEPSPAILASRVTVPAGADLADAIAALRSDASVESVAVDRIVPMLETYSATQWSGGRAKSVAASAVTSASSVAGAVTGLLPNDPFLVAQYWHYNMVDAPRAWATTTGSASVLVAVVDDGIRFDDAAIAPNLTHDGYNFVTGGNRLTSPQPVCEGGTTVIPETGYGADPTAPDDLTFTGTCWDRSEIGDHGMHVAGTIGAVGNDGVGSTGLNWTVSIRPVRVLDVTGGGSFFDVAQGILYAAGLPASNGAGGTVTAPSRAAIINMSLGGDTDVTVMSSAVTAATNAGSLIIAAAGNEEVDLPEYPAAYPQVLAVVALGPDLQLASYTNLGTAVGLAAPGGGQRFDYFVDGSAGVLSTTWDFVHQKASYAFYEGTSMATPHVSGVAALVLAANPGMTGAQLRTRLQSTAVDLGPPGPDDIYGYGLVNAYNAVNNVTAPPRATYVRLMNAATGDTIRTVAVGAGGSFAFALLNPGTYYVVAGQDENGDGRIGVPARRFGWYGTRAGPAPIALVAGQNAVASLVVGTPVVSQPDNTLALANRLVVNGYAINSLASTSIADRYVIQIPTAGTYYFETGGVLGSCGFGLELDTVLSLFSPTGTRLASNDDSVFPGSQYCSAFSATLTPGTYSLQVTSSFGSIGQYRVWVRNQP